MHRVMGGQEKEPKAAHGDKRGRGGKMPVVHSHSMKPHRKIAVKRGHK